jgi:prepilin-type N-terminal cleavage/methylation domain-containing protein
MAFDKRRGFTIIELVVVIGILAILAMPGAYFMTFIVQNSVFIPSKLNMDMIGQEAMDIILEGDSKALGARFSRIFTVTTNTSTQFKNSDDQTVRFDWNAGTKNMTRTINGALVDTVPYYLRGNISIINIATTPIFTYYDSSESMTTTPSAVRRLRVALKVASGSGNYSDWQGSSEQISSVAVHKYE